MTVEAGPQRKFGGWTGLFVVVASMVGVGILTTSGFTIQNTQSLPTLLLLWAAGGALALAGAISIAEPATAMPHVGGDYVYVRAAFGPAVGFVYGWSELLVGFTAPTALIALSAVNYLLAPVQSSLSVLPLGLGSSGILSPTLASLVIVVLAWSHYRGHRTSARVQSATTLFKFATLLGLAILGLSLGEGSWDHFVTGRPVSDQSAFVLAGSLAWIMFGYSGWNAAVYLAGEIRDPARLLPRCLVGGCLIVTLLYLIINLTYGYALDPSQVGEMQDVVAVAQIAAQELFGSGVAAPLAVILGLGLLASVSAVLLLGPRVAYAMARDGLFPRFAGTLHPVHGTPAAATLAQGLVAVLFCWCSFEKLFQYTAAGLAVLSATVIITPFFLRGRPDYQPAFRIPAFPIPPLLFSLVSIWIAVHMVLSDLQGLARSTGESPGGWPSLPMVLRHITELPSVLGCLSMLAGFPVYWLLFGRKAEGGRRKAEG